MEIKSGLWELLEESGHPLTRSLSLPNQLPGIRPNDSHAGPGVIDTHGTTVIAVK